MKKYILRIDQFFSVVMFSPISIINKLRGLPIFISNLISYRFSSKGSNNFPIRLSSLFPVLADRYESAGNGKGHYFFQDLHVASMLFKEKPSSHVDIGSRLDGFIAHLLVFMKITYVDIRKLPIELANLTFQEGSIVELPFRDDEINSLSCLHVLEHIGLGRYGDPVDPAGHIKAAKELQRVVAPKGKLYVSMPVGKERLCYDAHRIFNPNSVLKLFDGMKLLELYLIDDQGEKVTLQNNFVAAEKCDYGCGIFIFEKQ